MRRSEEGYFERLVGLCFRIVCKCVRKVSLWVTAVVLCEMEDGLR